MPRRPRQEEAGAIHHVFARGVRSTPIFRDADDHRHYLRLLGRATRQQRWNCLAYCLMTNHVHLLIETPEPNLGIGMSRFHGDYARRFNERHDTKGHVFQGRYGAVRILDDKQLITVVRYIDDNPAKGGLGVDWPWCSASARQSETSPPWLATERLLEILPAALSRT